MSVSAEVTQICHCLFCSIDTPWQQSKRPALFLRMFWLEHGSRLKHHSKLFTNWNVNRVGCFDAHRTKCPYSAEVTMQTHLYKSWIAMKLWSCLDDTIHSNQFCSSQQYTTAMNYSCQFLSSDVSQMLPSHPAKKTTLAPVMQKNRTWALAFVPPHKYLCNL